MIRTATVLVLGAGASVDYGFPTGADLRRLIVGKIRGKGRFFDVLCELHETPNGAVRVEEFGSRLAASGVFSIDNFLAQRRRDNDEDSVRIGLWAIAAALVSREDLDKLGDISKTRWYEVLWNRLIDGAHEAEAILANNLKIVTFNYDRSFETWLDRAARAMYGEDAASTLVQRYPIIHLHGRLEPIHEAQGGYLPYSSDLQKGRVARGAMNIILPDDTGNRGRDAQEASTRALKTADRICFLGFGFGSGNLEKLVKGISTQASTKEVVATTQGLGARRRDEIFSALVTAGVPRSQVHLEEMGISELLTEVLE